MIPVVFDTSVVVAAVGWGGHPWRCLELAAHHYALPIVTTPILEEYARKLEEESSRFRSGRDWREALAWITRASQLVEPAALGKRRSRDRTDDPFLAAALAGRAEAIVSNDRDLLELEKPFGIPVQTPVEFLRFVQNRLRPPLV